MINLVNLPEVVLEKIFSFLAYDSIAQNRVVCTKFNEIGSKMLNKGYYAADCFHGKTLKAIKAKLPRRESERRVHPLARQCDILIAIETRLSMLAMTFTKWMDAKLCCFIPGKVIDEIMRVLRCVANNPCPPRAHEILQELRDISSMAMEHFDEKILPTLKMSMGVPPFLQAGSSRADEELTLVPKQRLCVFPLHPSSGTVSVAEFNKLVVRESINRKKIKAQAELINKQANEISELRKHVEEWEAKLRDLTANLIKAKDLPGNSSAIVSTRQSRKRKSEDERIISNKKCKKGGHRKNRSGRSRDMLICK
ncbi:F-box only protein 28 isoform X2 [Halyomorpha halys]|uniref:F-box only protein 28 isoform X2 n=1 Tax=Halyomorpha halys TaxID=286706 RepID=UPI0006D4E98D|nr:F-box only protein 28 isoform X2 [Halyomorpha halys]